MCYRTDVPRQTAFRYLSRFVQSPLWVCLEQPNHSTIVENLIESNRDIFLMRVHGSVLARILELLSDYGSRNMISTFAASAVSHRIWVSYSSLQTLKFSGWNYSFSVQFLPQKSSMLRVAIIHPHCQYSTRSKTKDPKMISRHNFRQK